MTETEWLSSDDPQAMLAWLENTRVARGHKANRYGEAAGRYDGGPSDRKLRLFAVACVWLGGTTSARLREATEDAEAYAEGGERRNRSYDMNAESAAKAATCAACSDWGSAYWLRPVTRDMKAALLRDIVGDPVRPVTLPKSWEKCRWCSGRGRRANTGNDGPAYQNCGCKKGQRLTGPCPWLTPDVVALAHAAYDLRRDDGTLDPVRLSILADALEEAGCVGQCEFCAGVPRINIEADRSLARRTFRGRWQYVLLPSPGILGVRDQGAECLECEGTGHGTHPVISHLRSPGPHYRGCWAVDLILGRE